MRKEQAWKFAGSGKGMVIRMKGNRGHDRTE